MLDFIGDIHGHADKLEALLQKMGYEKQNGIYKHQERKALFLGDYIDRGPKIRETLEIVKAMVDEGHATALMGNHEYNALLDRPILEKRLLIFITISSVVLLLIFFINDIQAILMHSIYMLLGVSAGRKMVLIVDMSLRKNKS